MDPSVPVGKLRWPRVFADVRNLLVRLRVFAKRLALKYPPHSFGLLLDDVVNGDVDSLLFDKLPSHESEGITQHFLDNVSFVRSSPHDILLLYVDRCVLLERLLDPLLTDDDYLSSFVDLVEIPTQVMNNLGGGEATLHLVYPYEIQQWVPAVLKLANEENFFVEDIRSSLKPRYFSKVPVAETYWCYNLLAARPNILIRVMNEDHELVGFLVGVSTSDTSTISRYPPIDVLWDSSSEVLLYIHWFYIKKACRRSNVAGSILYAIIREIQSYAKKSVHVILQATPQAESYWSDMLGFDSCGGGYYHRLWKYFRDDPQLVALLMNSHWYNAQGVTNFS